MMDSSIAIEVKDSAFDPDSTEKIIRVRNRESDRPLYRVFLYVDGPDLPFVEAVTYELHPTFASPVRRVGRTLSNPRCKLEIWTWGLFEVAVTVEDKRGRQYRLSHNLQYDRQFNERDVKFLPG